MDNPTSFRLCGRREHFSIALCLVALLIFSARESQAAAWNGIEPLKSRRADVEHVLGHPLIDQPGVTGTLQFKVAGGTVTVTFVTAKFIQVHKLAPGLEGTVQEIVLQHDNASDTPESLGLTGKKDFQRQDGQDVTVFRNTKEGLAYTFIGGKLKTTYYSPSAEQLARAQRG